MATPVLWFIFSVHYAGKARWLNPRNQIGLFVVPAVVLLFVWTLEFHDLYYLDVGMKQIGDLYLFITEPGLVYWIGLVYSYLLFFGAVFLLIRTAVLSPGFYGGQIILVLFGAFIPLIGNILYNFLVNPRIGVDLTPLFFTITGIIIAWALFRYQFLDLAPFAREQVIDSLQDGTLVLDNQNRIVDLNPAMENIIGMQADQVIGQSADQVFIRVNFDVLRVQRACRQMEQMVNDEGCDDRPAQHHRARRPAGLDVSAFCISDGPRRSHSMPPTKNTSRASSHCIPKRWSAILKGPGSW